MAFLDALFDFLMSLAFYTWFATALFWGIGTFAFSSWAKLKAPALWPILGAALPVVGLLAALITYAVVKNRPSAVSQNVVEPTNYQGSENLW
jgi:hypothetical protein